MTVYEAIEELKRLERRITGLKSLRNKVAGDRDYYQAILEVEAVIEETTAAYEELSNKLKGITI